MLHINYQNLLNLRVKLLSVSLFVISFIACADKTSTAGNKWQTQSQFLKLVERPQGYEQRYLAVSENLGIALLDSELQPLTHINRLAEHLDVRMISQEKQQAIMVTSDVNSGELLLIEIDFNRNAMAVKQTYQPQTLAFDAMCLNKTANGVELFAIDVLGTAHHLSVYRQRQNDWQNIAINQFAVGPNVKSCAVDEGSHSIFVVEENIGVWRYSTDPEHEVQRRLIQLTAGIEVEYVDTSDSGDVVIVSPDESQLWLYDVVEQRMSTHALDSKIIPKTVQVTRNKDQLLVNLFDDAEEQLVQTSLTSVSRARKNHNPHITTFTPYAQTDPVKAYGDAADDPAIWINASNPEASLVYGTDKKYGLNVYDLSGQLIHTLAVGRVNNVDIRYQVHFNGQTVDIATASNRTTNSISVFIIDRKTGLPTFINDIPTDLSDPYGLCMSHYQEQLSVWINDTDGRFQQYKLTVENDRFNGEKVQQWQVPSQPEGCVVDEQNQRLFYGEESTGVWLKQLASNVDDILIIGLDEGVEADIEGMGLYQFENQYYLLVSSQGNNRYAVYAVDQQHRFLGVFEIGTNWSSRIDGASETDGLAVTHLNLGQQLPNGLLVVQDGRNVMPLAPQNFKLVDGKQLQTWIKQRIRPANTN